MKTAILNRLRRLIDKADQVQNKVIAPTVQATPEWQPTMPEPKMSAEIAKDLAAICESILRGDKIAVEELLPFLCLEYKKQRAKANLSLADAYFQVGDLEKAKVFAQRAWVLSGFSLDTIEVYKKVFAALGDTAAIKEAHKRLGMIAAREGKIDRAIELFDSVHFAHAYYDKVDKWDYDFDILSAIDTLAAPDAFRHITKRDADQRKVKIGYLVRGINQPNSVLIQANLAIAKCHDKDKFDIHVFAPEPASWVLASPDGVRYVDEFKSYGCTVVLAPEIVSGQRSRSLRELARQIHDADLDILVTSAALADYSSYYIAALRPAPFVMGLILGPPPQFAAPSMDWAIAWSKHPLIDTPVNCSIVQSKTSWSTLASAEPVKAVSRESLGVPADACVLVSGGRYAKFQNAEHWRAIGELLDAHSSAYYVVSGPTKEEIKFIADFRKEVQDRIVCLGWRADFVQVVAACDIVIDTYPNGGGQVIVEAMGLGLPIVSHRNDFWQLYDQTNWSPVQDFLDDDQMVIQRGDFEQFKSVLTKMIADERYRRSLGDRCLSQIKNIAVIDGVKECEAVYSRVLSRAAGRI